MLNLFSNGATQNRLLRAAIATFGRGIHKRIDENRELLQYLDQYAPEFMRAHPWVRGWIQGNDEFFVELERVAGIQNPIPPTSGRTYPRPWPPGPSATVTPLKPVEPGR